MSKRTRVTTSVSTIVNQVDSMITIAKVARRADLLKVLLPLKSQVSELEKNYNSLRSEIDPLVAILMPKESNADDEFLKEIEKELAEN